MTFISWRTAQPRWLTAIRAASLPLLERVREGALNKVKALASLPGGLNTTGELTSPSFHLPTCTTEKAAVSCLSHSS